MTMEIATLSDVMTLGDVLARSGFFQDARGAAQAVVKVLAGRELGFGPIASMTGVHIVKGKPSLSANMIAAAVKRSGKYDYKVREHTVKVCRIEFFEKGHDGKWATVGESSFSLDDAKTAELSGDNWRHYPKNMLFARAMSNGQKWYAPDVSGGPVYTPEELGIDVDGETGEVKNLSSVTVDEIKGGDANPVRTGLLPMSQPSVRPRNSMTLEKGGDPPSVRTDARSDAGATAPSPGSMDTVEAPTSPMRPWAEVMQPLEGFADKATLIFTVPEEAKEKQRLLDRIGTFPAAKITLRRKQLGYETDHALEKFDVVALTNILKHLEPGA